MNERNSYLGVYIKAKMKNMKWHNYKSICPNDHHVTNNKSKFCDVCGSKLIIKIEKTSKKQNFYNLMNNDDVSWDHHDDMIVNNDEDFEYFMSNLFIYKTSLDDIDVVCKIYPKNIEDEIDVFCDKYQDFINMIEPFYDSIELNYGVFVHDC